VGRFASVDPMVGYDEESPMTFGPYMYGSGNTVNRIDPTGNVDFTIAGCQISIGIGGYLATTAASYGVGKATQAAYIAATDGDFTQFDWFEGSDLLSLIPGGVLANVVRLPLRMVTTVSGKVVGRFFAAGAGPHVVTWFGQWFASTGGKMILRTANGALVELEMGTAKKGFMHILQRHLVGFWNGSKKVATTFFPAETSPGRMVDYLQEAASKYVAGGPVAQTIKLANGIVTELVIHGGKVTTFFAKSGPGVFSAANLISAL
jgi:hypothetical protein